MALRWDPGLGDLFEFGYSETSSNFSGESTFSATFEQVCLKIAIELSKFLTLIPCGQYGRSQL